MSGASKTRFVFVVSTTGSVMNQVLDCDFLKSRTHSVIASENCVAVDKARAHGVTALVFDEASNEVFCERLADYMQQHQIDYVLSFYTQFYTEEFRRSYVDRIVNFHPSLLPAFKGMDGFGDGVAYHAKIIGTTVEFIKDVMDEGKIIMQSACPLNPHLDLASLRHLIFVQQCRTLLQVVAWIADDRVEISGDEVTIRGARYEDLEFVPSLDFVEALELRVPARCQH